MTETERKFIYHCRALALAYGLVWEFWWSYKRGRRQGMKPCQAAMFAAFEWDVVI